MQLKEILRVKMNKKEYVAIVSIIVLCVAIIIGFILFVEISLAITNPELIDGSLRTLEFNKKAL